MVFGNSTGKVWGVVQRAVANAGLAIEPEKIVILNKGQRSVKGLASGFEHVATLDLVLTMVPVEDGSASFIDPNDEELAAVGRELAEQGMPTPSHLYLELLRLALRRGWSVSSLDLRTVTAALVEDGWTIEPKSGRLTKPSISQQSEQQVVVKEAPRTPLLLQ